MLPGMSHPSPVSPDARATLVVCVCASWCGVCRDFAATFARLTQDHPHTHFRWLDLEDDAELLDELEVDNFPTLLLGVDQQLVFHGPVLPQLPGLQRLLREAVHLPALRSDAQGQQLLQRVLAAATGTH
jgi:thiol-disulfide isomerase/thioredoxin